MKRLIWSQTSVAVMALAMAGGALLAGCGAQQQQSLGDPQLDLGRSVYQARCLSCHGTTGKGALGPAIGAGKMAARYPRLADHRAVVATGRRLMPSFTGILSAAEIDAVVRYTNERLGR